MTIWAQTLFKNEERWLWYSVASVVEYVDKILLWDTGSSDNSWEIAKELKKRFPQKIELRQYGEVNTLEFAKVRQEMLEATRSDWFMVLDADEIWWRENIKKVVRTVSKKNFSAESVVVPTINLVGDIYHYQEAAAGKYNFVLPSTKLKGHYNLRLIKRSIPGLHSKGEHGVWGWVDGKEKMIQDRKTAEFIDTPYLHASFLPRGASKLDDKKVPKRKRKLKYEIGRNFPLDFYYPEVFFNSKPGVILSPWERMDFSYTVRGYLETPLRKIKRRFLRTKVGY